MISKIRQNKKMLFVALGFVSGAFGALLADIFNVSNNDYIANIFSTAIWAGVFSIFISLGLLSAIQIYNRKTPDWLTVIKKAIPIGLIAGVLSGGFAQLIFGLTRFSDLFIHYLFQAICWGIMGLIMGWRLSCSIPNMNKNHGLIAGFIGGFIGGVGFILTSMMFPELPGRMLGIGILGAALGLCMIIVEERYRSAFLEVHWGPHEANEYTLGEIPVYIGGEGTNDIYVPNTPNHAVSITMENGIIKVINTISGETKVMKEGSKILMGNIEFIVHANK